MRLWWGKRFSCFVSKSVWYQRNRNTNNNNNSNSSIKAKTPVPPRQWQQYKIEKIKQRRIDILRALNESAEYTFQYQYEMYLNLGQLCCGHHHSFNCCCFCNKRNAKPIYTKYISLNSISNNLLTYLLTVSKYDGALIQVKKKNVLSVAVVFIENNNRRFGNEHS